MRIGFTYDLKDDYMAQGFTKEQLAEFDSIATIDAISSAIEANGHSVDRIGNVFALSKALLDDKRWDLVFNICEGLQGSGRESLVPALLDAYKVPYTFSDPLVHAITLNKAVTKKMLRHTGLPTTDFITINSIPTGEFAPLTAFPYFVKAVSEGTGKGITPQSKVFNMDELLAQVAYLIKTFDQPVIVEPFLTGREVTVGVLGTGADAFCVGVMEITFTDKADSDTHSYYNKEFCETAVVYTLIEDDFAKECASIALAAHRALDIKDACRVDIRADHNGKPQIIEINSLPGLMPGRSDLILLTDMAKIPYTTVIGTIIDSAIKR